MDLHRQALSPSEPSTDGLALPHLSGSPFITDGGLETSLIFLDGLDLPCLAAFPLVLTESGRTALTRYFEPYLEEAQRRALGFVLDTATWRANPDWAEKLGYGLAQLRDANLRAVAFAAELRDRYAGPAPIVINGVVGPRGDGYVVGTAMTADEAARYHGLQVEAFRDGGADMVSAITMTYAEEAIGVALAAQACGLPAVVSFTVETDGRLPSGQRLGEAIAQTDAATGGYPAYYMINCAHPEHFASELAAGEPWLDRIRGLRANASRKSHAELDESPDLDSGNPVELGGQYKALQSSLRHLCVVGGCCGTDYRHIRAICEACFTD